MTVMVTREGLRMTRPLQRYHCPSCRQWYQPTEFSRSVSCCVMHAPGDCCHWGEDKVTKKGRAR